MKNWLIAIAISLLIVVVFLILVLAIIAAAYVADVALGMNELALNIVGVAPILSTIAISSGVLIAILTFSRDRGRLAREREENRSKILLEQAKEGLDEVYELLKDQNNTRVIWIRAARVLLESVALGNEIKAPEFVKAYRLYADRIRSELFRALTVYNEETQERDPLPPQFFYGIKDFMRSMTLDKAAIEVSPGFCAGEVSIDSVVAEPSLRQLSPKSVVAVFDFLKYPSDYSDPLESVQVWEDDWGDSHGPSQGARRYVTHANETYAIDGKLCKR